MLVQVHLEFICIKAWNVRFYLLSHDVEFCYSVDGKVLFKSFFLFVSKYLGTLPVTFFVWQIKFRRNYNKWYKVKRVMIMYASLRSSKTNYREKKSITRQYSTCFLKICHTRVFSKRTWVYIASHKLFNY